MVGGMVFKYGPVEPHHHPPCWPLIIKYAPIGPEVTPEPLILEEPKDKELKVLLRQIAACLKKIKKLLEKAETETIAEGLGLLIAELSLLYTKLYDLQGSGRDKTIVFKPSRRSRSIMIMYIVMAPARPPKKE